MPSKTAESFVLGDVTESNDWTELVCSCNRRLCSGETTTTTEFCWAVAVGVGGCWCCFEAAGGLIHTSFFWLIRLVSWCGLLVVIYYYYLVLSWDTSLFFLCYWWFLFIWGGLWIGEAELFPRLPVRLTVWALPAAIVYLIWFLVSTVGLGCACLATGVIALIWYMASAGLSMWGSWTTTELLLPITSCFF